MMDNNLGDELHGESLQQEKLELRSTSADEQQNSLSGFDNDDLNHEDGSLWDGLGDEVDKASDLDREWQRRHDQFHTIGYRDGLIAGKEAAAQEGFNIGFKQSVLVGYNWGLVKGVTSAFAAIPDGLKENLVKTQQKRNEFQGLYESMHSLSTTDALRLFSEDIKAREKQGEHIGVSPDMAGFLEQPMDNYHLGDHFKWLESLIPPAIEIDLPSHQ